jgi:hypothetical protein
MCLVIVAVSAASLSNGYRSASAAFDVKQICHEAVRADLHAYHGLRSSGAYSIAHETVANRHGNLKEVHGDGKYQSSGGTKTFKFDCLVNMFDGRVQELDVHN